jgi:hypothetical protein
VNDQTSPEDAIASLATPSVATTFPDVESWFMSLFPGRQAVLRDDKWMLASAAFRAGMANAAPATMEKVDPPKPWGYSFMCSNGDGTSSQDIVQGEIPSWKHDVRNIVPLYAGDAPSTAAEPSIAPGEADAEIERLRQLVDVSKDDAERWQAFFSSDRFYVMGWSGFDCDAYPEAKVSDVHDPVKDWLHFTLNVWDQHPAGNDKQGTHGRNLLLAYVEYRRKLLASAPKEVAAEG